MFLPEEPDLMLELDAEVVWLCEGGVGVGWGSLPVELFAAAGLGEAQGSRADSSWE